MLDYHNHWINDSPNRSLDSILCHYKTRWCNFTCARATSNRIGSLNTDAKAVIDPLSPSPIIPIFGARFFSLKNIAASMKSVTWVSFLSPVPDKNQLSSKYLVPINQMNEINISFYTSK